MQNGRFPSKIALSLKKVCYKASVCENCQRQSCKAFIGLTVGYEMMVGKFLCLYRSSGHYSYLSALEIRSLYIKRYINSPSLLYFTLLSTAHTVGLRCVALTAAILQSWLMQQSSHRLRNDLKCVEWDVNPYYTLYPT